MAKIAILEDEVMVAHMVRNVIHAEGTHQVCLIASSGKEFKEQWSPAEADILLLDLVLPDCDGLELVSEIVGFRPDSVPVVVFSGVMSSGTVQRVLKSNVRGFFDKFSRPSALIEAIDNVLAGKRHVSANVAAVYEKVIVSGQSFEKILTKTEVRLLPLFSLGLNNREIGVQASVAEATVQTHRRNIMEKLNVISTTQLVRFGIENGLVQQRGDGSLSAPPW